MRNRKGLVALFVLTAVLLAGLLGARPIYNFYRDVSFSWTNRSAAEKEVKAFAEEKGISYGEYPQAIIDLYESNPETRDFVLNYPFREKKAVDLSAYDSSQGVPLFLQWDPMWGYQDYGSSCIAITGCGPTCLAMVGYYLTGDSNMSPDQIAFLDLNQRRCRPAGADGHGAPPGEEKDHQCSGGRKSGDPGHGSRGLHHYWPLHRPHRSEGWEIPGQRPQQPPALPEAVEL